MHTTTSTGPSPSSKIRLLWQPLLNQGKGHESQRTTCHHAARSMAARLPWLVLTALAGPGERHVRYIERNCWPSPTSPPPPLLPQRSKRRREPANPCRGRVARHRTAEASSDTARSRHFSRRNLGGHADTDARHRRSRAATSRASLNSMRASSAKLRAGLLGVLSIVHPSRVGGGCALFVLHCAPLEPSRTTLLQLHRHHHEDHHGGARRWPESQRT